MKHDRITRLVELTARTNIIAFALIPPLALLWLLPVDGGFTLFVAKALGVCLAVTSVLLWAGMWPVVLRNDYEVTAKVRGLQIFCLLIGFVIGAHLARILNRKYAGTGAPVR